MTLPADLDTTSVRWMLQHVEQLTIAGRPELLQGFNLRNLLEPRTGLFPAIAVPVLSKNVFECPTEHLEALTSRLPAVTKVLIIGWRGQERHFLSLLSEKLRPGIQGLIAAGSLKSAQEIAAGLREAGVRVTFAYIEGGFSDLMRGPELDRLLQR